MARVRIDCMTEGDWLVSGTQDRQVALAAIVGDDKERPASPEAVQAVADWCHEMLRRARPGYYRKINCLPGSLGELEGWSWELGYASGPAYGVFKGVYFHA